MGEFLGSIYCWLEDFFGLELANYLWGQSSPEQQSNMYIGIGLSMLCITFFIVVTYYYVVNHPRLNNWWGWLIFAGVNAAVNMIDALIAFIIFSYIFKWWSSNCSRAPF